MNGERWTPRRDAARAKRAARAEARATEQKRCPTCGQFLVAVPEREVTFDDGPSILTGGGWTCANPRCVAREEAAWEAHAEGGR